MKVVMEFFMLSSFMILLPNGLRYLLAGGVG
jgi:hypothetical protein